MKADPRVHKVVETREKARISGAFPAKVDKTPQPPQAKYTIPSSTPNPPYNHEAVNEDWGVTQTSPFLCLGQE